MSDIKCGCHSLEEHAKNLELWSHSLVRRRGKGITHFSVDYTPEKFQEVEDALELANCFDFYACVEKGLIMAYETDLTLQDVKVVKETLEEELSSVPDLKYKIRIWVEKH